MDKLNGVGALSQVGSINYDGGPKKNRGPQSIMGDVKYVEKETLNADGTISRKYYNNGVLKQETVYKVAQNGKEIIASVSRYSEKIDKDNNIIKTIETFVDEDGDGYDDYTLEKTFKNGNLVEEKKQIEEKMSDVKNRQHGPWETENRRMTAHDSGMYIC